MMWNGFGPGGCGWGGGLAMFLMMVCWIAMIGLIIFAALKMVRHGHGCCSPETSDALDIAKERYAKGEITEKEFDQIKKTLS